MIDVVYEDESVVDVISKPLKGVIVSRTVRFHRAIDDLFNSFHQLLISCPLVKTTLKCLLRILIKAFHTRTVRHHLHSLHYVPLVLADEFECEEKEKFEMKENIGIYAIHQLKIVLG